MIILANLRLESKDFSLPASDCVSTDANDSQLRLALACISSLTCLVRNNLIFLSCPPAAVQSHTNRVML